MHIRLAACAAIIAAAAVLARGHPTDILFNPPSRLRTRNHTWPHVQQPLRNWTAHHEPPVIQDPSPGLQTVTFDMIYHSLDPILNFIKELASGLSGNITVSHRMWHPSAPSRQKISNFI